ncbi:hypothetical protein VTK56DRAFT_676 [Thermocarpiscus australiensis]
MNALWSSRGSGDGAATGGKPATDAPDAIDTGIIEEGSLSPTENKPNQPSKRPLLHRNQQPQAAPPPPPPSAAAPPNPPWPPASTDSASNNNAASDSSNHGSSPAPPQSQSQSQQQQQQQQQPPPPQDSLSLAQLRRIVAEFPRTEPIAYDYVYADMGPLDEEIDEWFMHNFWQWVRLNAANRAFHTAWGRLFPGGDGDGDGPGWDDDDDGEGEGEGGGEAQARRRLFVGRALAGLRSADRIVRGEAVGALVYLVLGRWTETVRSAAAGGALGAAAAAGEGKARSAATGAQLRAMKDGVRLVAECGGFEVVWEALRAVFELFWTDELPQNVQMATEELIHLMTIMYVAIQEALDDPDGMADVRAKLLALNPSLVCFMLHVTAKLRWDESGILPQTQIFLLFWKSILLVFGGSKEIAETKEATRESQNDGDKEMITASPLDYHVFRQEITSKYPAYVPPQPQIPLEADQTTLLPQLPNHPTRNNGANGILPGPPGQSGGASILHQPVHIATPAPSPPPSPGVGGKGGKKQNYQTNQNFPFMYPPLDATSNSAGGKGAAALQDQLVGRKWEGSDVPASILEAGELFSKRVRMTRATRQLWAEREEFLKYERGWKGADDDIVDELDLSELTLEEKEELGLANAANDERPRNSSKPEVDYGPREVDQETKRRLDAVEEFYREALPHLQSLVIVLLKQIVAIATNLVTPASANGQPGAGPPSARPNGQSAPNSANGAAKGDPASPLDADVDELRSKEIAAKAVTGILILLLKWLKLSHVLKFEYMTQLLLDSNYLFLVLKLFAMHDVQQVVESKTDRLEHSFFYFCGSRADVIPQPGIPNQTATEFDISDDGDDDDAAPPPIKRRRSPPTADPESQAPAEAASAESAGSGASEGPVRPEVDELGFPVNPLPDEPITDFSRRNFFALINYLRVMQKICKRKAHRNWLLVSYKSSNILRKALRVPQQELRLYTLKLFKNQVPFCGRKWRQSNMRVITAVYLHCRPELRDEWLAGCDVDAEVEEALPLEQALRSLTHWFNVRRYPDRVAAEVRQHALREEQDFFVRELEKADLSWAAEAEGGGEEAAATAGMGWEHEGAWG